MRLPGPTDRQREIWEFCVAYQAEHGAPPSLREIGDRFGIQSNNGVSDHLKALEAKGLMKHYPHRARGWVPCE